MRLRRRIIRHNCAVLLLAACSAFPNPVKPEQCVSFNCDAELVQLDVIYDTLSTVVQY